MLKLFITLKENPSLVNQSTVTHIGIVYTFSTEHTNTEETMTDKQKGQLKIKFAQSVKVEYETVQGECQGQNEEGGGDDGSSVKVGAFIDYLSTRK